MAPQSSIAGKLTYHLLPVRRRTVLANLRRAFRDLDDREIVHIAQASYGHLLRSIAEVVRSSFMSTRRYVQCARVENAEAGLRAVRAGKGVLLLTGHFGNWEVALPAAISPFPEWQGRIHIVRKRLPGLLDGILSQRFNRAGIKVIPRTGRSNRFGTIADRKRRWCSCSINMRAGATASSSISWMPGLHLSQSCRNCAGNVGPSRAGLYAIAMRTDSMWCDLRKR